MPKSEKKNIHQVPPVLDRVLAAAQVAEESHAKDVAILDVRELTKAFDYFLIASASSKRQLLAIGDEIQKKLCSEMGDVCLSVAGTTEGKWVAIDYGDIIVHLFEPDTRTFYALEELWGKAAAVKR
jgi:ribosome-associated protein